MTQTPNTPESPASLWGKLTTRQGAYLVDWGYGGTLSPTDCDRLKGLRLVTFTTDSNGVQCRYLTPLGVAVSQHGYQVLRVRIVR